MKQGVGPRQLDAIREVVNIGAGHAATALSTMTNLRVMISIPRIAWADASTPVASGVVGGEAAVMVAVPILGEGRGEGERAALILGRETAVRMIGLLLRREPTTGEFGALERSTLLELGNILCAAYVGVLGNFLGRGVMIGAPELTEMSGDALRPSTPGDLLIETDFSFRDASFEGVFVLSHAELSLSSLLSALGLEDAS
jgi:chemotaxis protein CheC